MSLSASAIISFPLPDNFQSVSFDDFVARKVAPLIPDAAKLITIDGLDGAGKSTLMKNLAASIGYDGIDLDCFLIGDQNAYLDHIKYDELSDKVASESRKIVSGCIIDWALKRIGKHADFRIYVVRVSQMRNQPEQEWWDEADLLFNASSWEEEIEREEQQLSRFLEFAELDSGEPVESSVGGLRKELIRYHVDARPHEAADMLVKLVRYV